MSELAITESLISRQPILDAQQNLVGYELTLLSPTTEPDSTRVATLLCAAGLSRDNRTLVLFTVDARGGSAGMPVGEVADMLIRDYGVFNALNLDGRDGGE